MNNLATTQAHKLLTVEDIEKLPDLDWLIKGFLPQPAFGVLYGEPGSGKSFAALDMALACASGRTWLGRAVKEAKVLYIAAEGVLGFKNRLRAYRHRRGLTAENVRFIASPFAISDSTAVQALIDTVQKEDFVPGLIVIDTLARVALGTDENNAKDMGQVVAGFDDLKRETGATVLVIHHTRKDGGSERGSSALRCAADVMILCEKSSAFGLSVTLKCSKMKDDEPFPDIRASLEKVVLPSGGSSLVVGGPLDILAPTGEVADKIVEILEQKFSAKGATHSELVKVYCGETGKSKSTFDRVWRDLKNTDRVRVEDAGGKARYFPRGVSVKPVSNECQTQTQAGVMSPPSLGGDTDTKSKEEI